MIRSSRIATCRSEALLARPLQWGIATCRSEALLARPLQWGIATCRSEALLARPLHYLLALIALAFMAASSPAAGKRYAVLVGVQKYDDPAFHSRQYAENDTEDLARILSAAGYDVSLLTTSTGDQPKKLSPTRANIETTLTTTLAKCKSGDLVLLAFAGQGVRPDGKSAGYLCPSDAKPLPDGKASLISLKSLADLLAKSHADTAVMLIDAGGAGPKGKELSGVDASRLKLSGRVFALFSCAVGQSAVAHKEIQHGVFFNQILAGLRGTAADGNDAITFESLAKHIREEVPKQAAKLAADAKQTPIVLAPKNVKPSPVVAMHPLAIADSEWQEYLMVWSGGGTKPFLDKYAPKRFPAWRKAAEAGSPRGMMLVADCHEFGVGVTRDPKASVKWYTRSARHGNTFAMVGLGICYQRGFGVKKDEKEAVKWFRKGADLGDPGCMENLGSCYRRGVGVEKDEKEAVKWYQRSMDLGFAQAYVALGDCYLEGSGVKKDEKEVLRLFRKGVERKSGTCGALTGALLSTWNGS